MHTTHNHLSLYLSSIKVREYIVYTILYDYVFLVFIPLYLVEIDPVPHKTDHDAYGKQSQKMDKPGNHGPHLHADYEDDDQDDNTDLHKKCEGMQKNE